MKRTFLAIFLLLLGTAGCGVNLEWLPDPEPFPNISGINLTSQYTVTSFGNISGSNISGVLTKTFTPSGIAVDPNAGRDAVYVADDTNNRVLKFNRNGAFRSVFVDDLAGGTPGGIAVSSAGEVYVADTIARKVLRYTSAGSTGSLQEAIAVDGGLSLQGGLGDIAIASDSLSLYVTFPADNVVRNVVFDTREAFTFLPAGLNSPKGIAVNTNAVFISNSGIGRISKRDLNGNSQDAGSFGSLGNGARQLSAPVGIAADTSKVYVADSNNKRIQIFNVFGVYQGFIGRSGTDGEFTKPLYIAVDSSGNLYVAEANRIQKFTKK